MSLLVFNAERPASVKYMEPGYTEYARKLMAYNSLWKARRLNEKDGGPCIEIRKQVNNASLKIVVYKNHDNVALSLNATAFLSPRDMAEIRLVIDEARQEMES